MNNTVTLHENAFLGEKYYHIKHKSGLPIYVFPKNHTSTYAIIGTNYGSVDNKFKLKGDKDFIEVPAGIAHFLEHKLFANEDGTDSFEKFSEFGASANAYTSNNMTAYLFSCTENFKESLEILLDFVTHPFFTPDSVEKEQGILAQELRMYEDHPGSCLFYNLLEAMYEKHSVRINVGGTVESISHITADILYDCYRVFYNLSNMTLSICGDVSVDEVLEVADKILPEKAPVEIVRYTEDERPEVYKKKIEKKMEVAMPLFAIGIKDSEISDDPMERLKKAECGEILGEILFGTSGEFFNDLYENGMIQSLDDGFDHHRSFSFNVISGEARDPDAVYAKFVEYIDKVKREGLDKKRFEVARRVLYADSLKDFDSTSEIANNILFDAFEGVDVFAAIDVIKSITYEDVCELFDKLYKEEHYALSVILPESK